MQRIIKFRAFNKTKGIMSEPFTLEDLLGVEVPLLSGSSMADEIIWIEFTGLLDKNGKEIYEGDIIQDENGTAEVVFHRAGFLNKPRNAPPYLITIWEECEVIGNIYSNSELLEVKDGPSGK